MQLEKNFPYILVIEFRGQHSSFVTWHCHLMATGMHSLYSVGNVSCLQKPKYLCRRGCKEIILINERMSQVFMMTVAITLFNSSVIS